MFKTRRTAIATIRGARFFKSRYYHGRCEAVFYGHLGQEIRKWIIEQFGDHDDMVYDSWYGCHDGDEEFEYDALVSNEQLTFILLRWS